MKNEIPKKQLLVIRYCCDIVGHCWIKETVFFPLLSNVLNFDNHDTQVIESSTIVNVYDTIEKILEGKDPETELEISVYKLIKERLDQYPAKN